MEELRVGQDVWDGPAVAGPRGNSARPGAPSPAPSAAYFLGSTVERVIADIKTSNWPETPSAVLHSWERRNPIQGLGDKRWTSTPSGRDGRKGLARSFERRSADAGPTGEEGQRVGRAYELWDGWPARTKSRLSGRRRAFASG